MSRSALEYDTKLALNNGLSGSFTADEAQAMGPDATAEMDCLFRFVGMMDREGGKIRFRAGSSRFNP